MYVRTCHLLVFYHSRDRSAVETKFPTMRLSTLAVGLIHLGGSASAFCPTNHKLSPFPRSPLLLRANVFDAWWEERRAQGTPHARHQSPTPSILPEPLQLDRENLIEVLYEFVRSDYAKQKCNHFNIQPVTDWGQIGGMFVMVKISGCNINLRLKGAFNERNEALLDRLARYLRARIPEIVELHAVHREGRDIY